MSHFDALATPGAEERAFADLFKERGAVEAVSDRPLVLIGAARPEEAQVLAGALAATGQIAGFGDLLTVRAAGQAAPGKSFAAYVTDHVHAVCPDGQGFGLVVDPAGLCTALRMGLPAFFAGVRLVHVTRADPLAQALAMARKDMAREVEPILDALAGEDLHLRLIARAAAVPRLEVQLEALADDPSSTLRRLAPFCGFAPGTFPVPAVTLPGAVIGAPDKSAVAAQLAKALTPPNL